MSTTSYPVSVLDRTASDPTGHRDVDGHVDDLLDELRRRLDELPTRFAEARAPEPDSHLVETHAQVAGAASPPDPLRKAIVLGRTVGVLLGAGVFHVLSARL